MAGARWGRWRGDLPGFAAFAAVAGAIVAPLGSAALASPPTTQPVGASTTTTTTLPQPAQVPLSVTDGVPAKTLLSNALTLASVGVDNAALVAALSITQAKIERDAAVVAKAEAVVVAQDQRARSANDQARIADAGYHSLDGAVKRAVLSLYIDGPSAITINPAASDKIAYAVVYADSALTPEGVLATRRMDAQAERDALGEAAQAQAASKRASAKAAKVLGDEQKQEQRLRGQLKSLSASTIAEVASDHSALAKQAGAELLSATSLQFAPTTRIPPLVKTVPVALSWAFSELGKPYVWGATGPGTFDCSGLTQFVWGKAGVAIPRVAADQDSWAIPVPLSDLLPGDLVFFGHTDIHHVGIYIGDGLMINAPHTGDVVRVTSIWWSDLAGFGRVHSANVPVPAHQTPTIAAPAKPIVVPAPGPVPSQTKPPAGWKPKPGGTTPITIGPTETTTTTTTVGGVTTTVPGPPSTDTTLPPDTTTSVPTDTTTTTSTTVPAG